MKLVMPRLRRKSGTLIDLSGALPYCIRALLAFMVAGARVYGGYAPFAAGAVAASGPGWAGASALLGASLGALVWLDFPHALRTTACVLLIYTANNAFCELRVYRRLWFQPALTAALMLAVEFVYLLRAGDAGTAAWCLLSALLAALFAFCCRAVLAAEKRSRPARTLVVLLAVLTALSSVQLDNGLAPGRIVSVLTVILLAFDRELSFALSAAVSIGLAMDCVTPGTAYLHTACYAVCALLTAITCRGSRLRAASIFTLSTALFSLPQGTAEGIILLYEGLAGTLVFLLLPNRLLQALHENPPEREDGLRGRLREAAAALRELHTTVADPDGATDENPAVIFDRTAEAVCRDCTLRELCWEREYGRTYNAFNDATAALLRNMAARGEDFPTYFSDRCVRLTSFLSVLNTELRAYLSRRQYRMRIEEANSRSARQYAQFAELLTRTAEQPAAEAAAPPPLPYRIGTAFRPKDGERVSGDSSTVFETGDGKLCILLSDGMGSGREAQAESLQAIRLLERFLRAGIDAEAALRTMNSAFCLRAEHTESFATVDLLCLSLRTGEGELYKYGAAPTYIKRGTQIRRIGCSSLPVGLAAERNGPEHTHLRVNSGSYLILLTDGAADVKEDGWLQLLLADWEGTNPQLLADSVLAESHARRGGEDDAGAVVLYLPGPGALPEEV